MLVLLGPRGESARRAADRIGRDGARHADGRVPTKVNINTADAKALTSLSGVNRSLAEKIVKYRDEHGAFKKPEDLRRVEGVGNGVWEKNRARISVK